MDIDKLRSAWPHVRTLLIGFHVLAVIALSMPTPHAVSSRDQWKNPNMQADLKQWSERLSFLGYDSPEELEEDWWNLAQGYLKVRKAIIRPFQKYSRYSATRQGWRMFSNPRIEPAVLHIDAFIDGAWQPVYRPHSDDYDFYAETLTHNRIRKLVGRLGQAKMKGYYSYFVRFLAPRAAAAFPTAEKLRFSLFRYRTLPPEDVRAGKKPRGKYERVVVLPTDKFREGQFREGQSRKGQAREGQARESAP